jgi:hypothetical protein
MCIALLMLGADRNNYISTLQIVSKFFRPAKFLSSIAMVWCLLASESTAFAVDAPAPLLNQLSFFGRWDLRSPQAALTINEGSYVMAHFSGDSVTAEFDISLNQNPLPTMAWRIDDGEWQQSEVQANLKLGSGLPGGIHTLCLMVRGIDEHQNRWTKPLTASITFLGLTLSENGQLLKPLDEWVHPKLKIEFLGDSITEGTLVQPGGCGPGKTSWAWETDALHSYSCQTAMLLGAAWRQVGFGATGLAHGGSGGAPGALDTFNSFYADCPRDGWVPDMVVINQGSNDRDMAPEAYHSLYARYLAMIREAYPLAKIVALRPFGGFQGDVIRAAVDEASSNGDAQIYYIDTEGWYSGDLHPNAKSSEDIARRLVVALQSRVL